MKKLLFIILLVIVSIAEHKAYAQDQEKYGNTFNAGIGIGYYGYAGGAIPAFNINYEFDVAKNFTLAPFVTAFTYRNYYYWGDSNNPYRDYYYNKTVVPVGLKGTYYLDELFNAGDRWDFYAAGSLGFAFVTTSYEDGYGGDRGAYSGVSPLYVDAHIGSELHLSKAFGIYLDLSTGLSTFGLAVHL